MKRSEGYLYMCEMKNSGRQNCLPFSSDIITRKVEGESKKGVEWNAMEIANEWVRHEYQNGWKI